MQAICAKCKGTGKVPKPLAVTVSNPDPDVETEWIKCPGCLGGGIIDTTATA